MMKRLMVIVGLLLLTLTFCFMVLPTKAVNAEGEETTTAALVEETTTVADELFDEEVQAIVAELVAQLDINTALATLWDNVPPGVKTVLAVFGIATPTALFGLLFVYVRKGTKNYLAQKQNNVQLKKATATITSLGNLVVNLAKADGGKSDILSKFIPQFSFISEAVLLLIQTSTKDEVVKRKSALLEKYTNATGLIPANINMVSESEQIAIEAVNLQKDLEIVEG